MFKGLVGVVHLVQDGDARQIRVKFPNQTRGYYTASFPRESLELVEGESVSYDAR